MLFLQNSLDKVLKYLIVRFISLAFLYSDKTVNNNKDKDFIYHLLYHQEGKITPIHPLELQKKKIVFELGLDSGMKDFIKTMKIRKNNLRKDCLLSLETNVSEERASFLLRVVGLLNRKILLEH